MDSSVDGKILRQKFFRVQNRVERFQGDCLLRSLMTLHTDFKLFYSRFVKPQASEDWLFSPKPWYVHNTFLLTVKKTILTKGLGTKKLSNVRKKESIPIQNKHDLLVGALSIGIPSIYIERWLLHTGF